MPSFKDPQFDFKYSENVIAALPRATLIYETFLFLEKVLLTGLFPGNNEVNVMSHNTKTAIDSLNKSIEDSLNMFLRLQAKQSNRSRDDCRHYGIQGVTREVILNLD